MEVLSNINLYIRQNEFLTLLGPSGCGKTTLLRIIAGFEEPTRGDVHLFAKASKGLPPYKRRVNTVFQKYALFPHLNVFDNIAFGLKIKKMDKTVIRKKVKICSGWWASPAMETAISPSSPADSSSALPLRALS